MKKLDAACPRCGAPPAVLVDVRGSVVKVTLNLRCEVCYRRGVTDPFYDVVLIPKADAA